MANSDKVLGDKADAFVMYEPNIDSRYVGTHVIHDVDDVSLYLDLYLYR